MKKGSPEGYNAETGLGQPAQKPHTGEPHERQPLYRIRCAQEKHQLLRQDGRRPDCRRRQTASDPRCAAAVGRETSGTMAWRHGSDLVQRLDLRHLETICGGVADGTPSDDESHRCLQEEERQDRRPQGSRPGALQSAAGMLRSAGRDAGAAATAALPECGGSASGADEEQDERVADGGGCRVQQAAITWEKIFHGVDGQSGRSTGVGEGSDASEPGRAGDVRGDAAPIAQPAAKGTTLGRAGSGAREYSRGGRGDGPDLGAGNLRSAAVPVNRGCRELLWADLGVGLFRRQAVPETHLQAAQWTLADGADRGRQTGAAMESPIGSGARAGTGAGKPQPGHLGGGAQAGRLFTGDRQIRPTLPHPESARPHNGGGNSGLTPHSELTSGKDGFPAATARRLLPSSRTVLAVKGALRRAQTRRALDGCGP